MLAGCGGPQTMKATPSVNEAPAFLERHHSFYCSGKEQFFAVPVDVTSITVIATGAAGGKKVGGRGGRVFAKVPVVPGERLAVFVGGAAMGVNGGCNGGAPGGYSGDGKATAVAVRATFAKAATGCAIAS